MENELVKIEETGDKVLIADNSPHGLLSQAIAQNANIDTLERLVALQKDWQKEEARKSFFTALTNFQSEVPELIKAKKVDFPSKEGGSVKYNYAPLGKITKTIQSTLLKFGLSYRWEFEDRDDKFTCWCIISHVDGHSEKSQMTAGKDTSGKKNDIQSIGSTRSYLQRYTLIAALGLSTADEDNDGTTSQTKNKESIPAPKRKINWSNQIKSAQTIADLEAFFERMTDAEREENKMLLSEIKKNILAELKK